MKKLAGKTSSRTRAASEKKQRFEVKEGLVPSTPRLVAPPDFDLSDLIPPEVGEIGDRHQKALPRIARDARLTKLIDQALGKVPTQHDLFLADARRMDFLESESVHLVVCSPPYWTLKEYRKTLAQLGHVSDYDGFLHELEQVWKHCFRVLVPGGRLICVVGDVCLSRRKNQGRHTVVPLHASIQERCRALGFDNVQGIIWHKIANAAYEVENGSGFLGKPYEPNAVIKNDIEYILMQRKPGGYRSPSIATRVMSVLSAEKYQNWFRAIWEGLPGASTKEHPAPYPVELAERLVRMFSFVGDTILDPFLGTGSTTAAAARCGRNSIGVEVDPHYYRMAVERVERECKGLFSKVKVIQHPIARSRATAL